MDQTTELPTDLGRLRLIARFAETGHGGQITVSHDICTRTRLRRWGGHGYGHILRNLSRLIARAGLPGALLPRLIRDNPLKLLTLTENAA